MRDELNLRADQAEDTMTAGDLPEQGGPRTPTILPGIHLFRLPAALAQCWKTFDVAKKDSTGAPLMDGDKPVTEQHLMLHFDRENPMIVIGNGPDDEFDGLPATATINTMGRKRGKRDDPTAPIVSDMTYFKVKALADTTPIAKRADWIPVINKHAGAIVRLGHGLSAQCREDAVRYVDDPNDPSKSVKDIGITTPDVETLGCGKKYYTQAFKVAARPATADEAAVPAHFTDEIRCECGARLRGFFSIEKFLEPVGQ